MVLKPSRRGTRRVIYLQNFAIFTVCLLTSYTALRFLMGQTLTGFIQNNIIPALQSKPSHLDFQSTVEAWAKDEKGQVAVVIYDLDNEKYSAQFNQKVSMPTASLYKLGVAYEEYLRVENGELSPSQIIVNGKTRAQCLDLMLRESNSPCAETLAAKDNIDFTLSASAEEIFEVMKMYYEHDGLSEDTWAVIKDSMLNQPIKDGYDWRQGLPSGFNVANVYDKVGWAGDGAGTWMTYNDAAIIELNDRHYIVVVMTSYTDPRSLSYLGQKIEDTMLTAR